MSNLIAKPRPRRVRATAVTALTFACFCNLGWAQHDTPEPLRDITDLTLWYESFDFTPHASLQYEYDDNIYATEDSEISDYVLLANLSGQMASDWDRHAVKAGAGAKIARYQDYGSEDTEDYWASLNGRYDLGADDNLFASLSHAREHEARGSIESVSGDEPTQYYKTQANAGIKQGAGPWSTTVAGNLVRYDYDDTPAGLTEINNDDRDRDESSLGVRISYSASAQWSYFAQYRTDVRNYESALDDALYERDSTGHRIGVGFKAKYGERLDGELMLGALSQDYEDPRFDAIDTFDYQGSLGWYVSEKSHLKLAVAHSLEETTLPGSPGYLYRQLSARWSQRYTAQLFGQFTASYGQAEYQQSAISDDYYDVGAGLTRSFARGVLGSINLRHVQRDSNQPGDDFSRNQVGVSVSARF